jgi:hypothetical protein
MHYTDRFTLLRTLGHVMYCFIWKIIEKIDAILVSRNKVKRTKRFCHHLKMKRGISGVPLFAFIDVMSNPATVPFSQLEYYCVEYKKGRRGSRKLPLLIKLGTVHLTPLDPSIRMWQVDRRYSLPHSLISRATGSELPVQRPKSCSN